MRPGVAHRTFQPDRTGQPRHPPADGIQRHDLVGDVAETLLHQLDRRGALALVGPAAQDDDAVAAGDRCGVGQQRGARPEHRDRGDRREHVGHRVVQRPAVAEQLAILGDDEPVVVPDVEAVDRRVARGGMGGQQRGERLGHPLVVAGDLERLTDGVEAPHGDRIARRRARRWPRREGLAVLLGADEAGDVGAEPAQTVGDRRRLLVERVGQRGDGVVEPLEQVPRDGRRTHPAHRRRASLPTADRRSPWRRRRRPPRTTAGAAARSPSRRIRLSRPRSPRGAGASSPRRPAPRRRAPPPSRRAASCRSPSCRWRATPPGRPRWWRTFRS